jgi:hypothetical protein
MSGCKDAEAEWLEGAKVQYSWDDPVWGVESYDLGRGAANSSVTLALNQSTHPNIMHHLAKHAFQASPLAGIINLP